MHDLMGSRLFEATAYEDDCGKKVQFEIWIMLQLHMLLIKNPHHFITSYNFIKVLN